VLEPEQVMGGALLLDHTEVASGTHPIRDGDEAGDDPVRVDAEIPRRSPAFVVLNLGRLGGDHRSVLITFAVPSPADMIATGTYSPSSRNQAEVTPGEVRNSGRSGST